MKQKALLHAIPLLVGIVSLTGCFNNGSSNPLKPIAKTVLKQKYSDYIQNNYYTFSATPSVGKARALVVPLWFTDSSDFISTDKKESVRQDLQTACFGTKEEIGWHSLKSYYEEESKGLLEFGGVVSSWYDMKCASSTYASSSSKTVSLATTVTDWYFQNNGGNDTRKQFDCDGDGYIDCLIMIYAVPDFQQYGGSSSSNFWAYTTWTQEEASKTKPVTNVFFWCSYDFFYGTNATERTGHNYHNGDTSHCTLDAHTLIHEQGHMFGLEDYYDYDKTYCFAGGFSMQDYNVGAHDAYSVMALGWANPYIPKDTVTITLDTFQTSHELILLTPSWNEYDSPFDEYLLLELYSPEGLNEMDSNYRYDYSYPQGPKSVGIRLWHVDSRLIKNVGSQRADYTTDATSRNLYLFASNSSSDNRPFAGTEGCNLLQLIRNDEDEGWETATKLDNDSLFKEGDSFSMRAFKKQFVNSTKLNNESSLKWSFTVKSIQQNNGKYTATIECKKV